MTPSATIQNTSYSSPATGKVLRHEGIVNAPRAAVWQVFTTSEGLRSFIAPVVAVDFRIGGLWEASYRPDAQIGDPDNIVNEILSYLPLEMLSIRIQRTPPGFPSPMVAARIWTVMQFADAGENQTRFTISMLGWQDGAEWDAVYQLFERGNAYTVAKLQEHFG